jgi:hypothetical protein
MKGIEMKPYIHEVHELENDVPGEYIATIKGKKIFREWVMKRYFEDSGSPVCFHLAGESIYYEAIPFVYMKGKNKGKDRVVFVKLRPTVEDAISDIPF